MNNARLSCCSYPLIKRPLDEALKVIADAGFGKVELLGRKPHFSLNPQETNLADLRKMLASHRLAAAGLGTYVGVGFASDDKAKQEAELTTVKSAIDAAVQVGARVIRVLRGKDCEVPEKLDSMVPLLKQAAAYAASKQVFMGVENHGGRLSGDVAKTKELFDKVGSPNLGLMYDPCNYFTYGGDYRKGLETLLKYVVHVHVKDAAVKDGKPGLVQLGTGQIDYRWIVKTLEGAGYKGDYSIEYELETEPPETALRKWHDYLAAI